MAKKRSTATRRADSQAAAARAAAIRREHERRERRRRSLVVTAVAVVVLVLIGAIAYAVQSSRDTTNAAGGAPSGTVGSGGYAIPIGSKSAPVKADFYEDFICPYCGQFEAASRSILQKDIDSGKLQIHYHPLAFLDRSSSTKYSTRSANAFAVVYDTSGGKVAKKFHDLLFENQPQEGSAGLTDSQLLDYAVQAGAKRSAVEDGIKNGRFEAWIAKGTNQASKDNVNGTPTVRIGGKTLQFTSADQLLAQVQSAVDAGNKK